MTESIRINQNKIKLIGVIVGACVFIFGLGVAYSKLDSRVSNIEISDISQDKKIEDLQTIKDMLIKVVTDVDRIKKNLENKL